jgi:putative transposase
MPQSLSQLFVHLVFSTKHRAPIISDTIREELHAYLIGILRERDCPSLMIGSVEDHIHILFVLSKNMALSKIVGELKAVSSKWIKSRGPSFHDFQCQNGYGAFSTSQSNVAAVRGYIANQKQHHHKTTFQEELRKFLEKHKLEYDERYLWD